MTKFVFVSLCCLSALSLPAAARAIQAPAPPAGQAELANEASVKAGFIPKFARYVDWPAALLPPPRQPFVICVIGRDSYGRLLDQAAAAELIGGRGVTVRRMPDPGSAAGCHLAVVQGEAAPDTARMLQSLRPHPILTITDGRHGPERGMVHFTVAQGRVRFFVDEAAAAASGLTISSRLLALALGVRQRRP